MIKSIIIFIIATVTGSKFMIWLKFSMFLFSSLTHFLTESIMQAILCRPHELNMMSYTEKQTKKKAIWTWIMVCSSLSMCNILGCFFFYIVKSQCDHSAPLEEQCVCTSTAETARHRKLTVLFESQEKTQCFFFSLAD